MGCSRRAVGAALLLSLCLSVLDHACGFGCTEVNTEALRACKSFLQNRQGSNDYINHLNHMYYPTENADNYFKSQDDMIFREYCAGESRFNMQAGGSHEIVDIQDFSTECQIQWLKYRCAQAFQPCQDPQCDQAPCILDYPCSSMRDDVESVCDKPYSNYNLRNCSCEDSHPSAGLGGLPGCLYCPSGGCNTVELPDCSSFNNGHNDEGNQGNGSGETCYSNDDCNAGCCCDISQELPTQCMSSDMCSGECREYQGSNSPNMLPVIILSAIGAILSVFIFIIGIISS